MKLNIEHGYCHCGCGERPAIAKATDRQKGYVKGEPRAFVKGHHARSAPFPYVVDDQTGCWNWQWASTKGGYGVVDRDGRRWMAHVWYWVSAHGPVAEGLQLDHLCENPGCVNPDHLEPVTALENMRRCRATKLTVPQVAAIRGSTESNRKLAVRYGVDPSNISHIRRGVSWRGVDAT